VKKNIKRGKKNMNTVYQSLNNLHEE